MELLSTTRWNQRYCASWHRHFSAGCRPTGSRCVQLGRSGAPSSARRVNTLLRPPARLAEVSTASCASTHTHQKIRKQKTNLLLLVQVEEQLQEALAKTWLSPKSWTLWLYLSSASLVAHSFCNTHTKYLIYTLTCHWTQIFVLCFRALGGLQVTKEQKEEQFHFLVFTDVFGNKTHGVVMQCHRPVQVHTATHRTVVHLCWRSSHVSANCTRYAKKHSTHTVNIRDELQCLCRICFSSVTFSGVNTGSGWFFRMGWMSHTTKQDPPRAAHSSQPTASASYPSIPTSLHSETVCLGET